MTPKPLIGRKVFFITAAFFAVIIGVNLTLAVQAVRTFPGLEVENSYVASQRFNADLAAQQGLGWTLSVTTDTGAIRLGFADASGMPVRPAQVSATLGRATEAREDSIPVLGYHDSAFWAPQPLAPGKWVLRVEAASATGVVFRQRIALHVKG